MVELGLPGWGWGWSRGLEPKVKLAWIDVAIGRLLIVPWGLCRLVRRGGFEPTVVNFWSLEASVSVILGRWGIVTGSIIASAVRLETTVVHFRGLEGGRLDVCGLGWWWSRFLGREDQWVSWDRVVVAVIVGVVSRRVSW